MALDPNTKTVQDLLYVIQKAQDMTEADWPDEFPVELPNGTIITFVKQATP